jgi:hypothetical protein
MWVCDDSVRRLLRRNGKGKRVIEKKNNDVEMSLLKEVMLIKYVKVEGKKECFKEKV